MGAIFYVTDFFEFCFSTSLLNFLPGENMNKYLVAQLVAGALQERLEAKQEEIERLIDILLVRDQEIRELQDEVRRARNTRTLVDRDGRTGLFVRDADGIFHELPVEEPIRNVRRRLNFDTDSDSESDDDFMTQLMFG
jgi:hypothetical protein